MKTVVHKSFTIFFVALFLVIPGKVLASLTTDVQSLVSQAGDVQVQLSSTQLTADEVCAPLVAASQAVRNLVESIQTVNGTITAPIAVDDSLLSAVEALFSVNVELADEAARFSSTLSLLVPESNAITIKDGLTAILQLSDDIGTMADRIGEMADKILVMADNIGVMADRILITQEIQGQNVAMTQATLLQTQTNVLTLVSAVETSSYNFDLNSIAAQGELLAVNLAATMFSPWTIKYQLAAAADDVENFKDQVLTMSATIQGDSVDSTMIIDDTTLLAMNNMAIMASSVATVLDGYNLVLESMAGMLTDKNLSASISSMLEMSADIGVVSNSILEMADNILVMADNIGLTADQILLTQQLQSSYMAVSQASILATQEMAIGLIVAEGL